MEGDPGFRSFAERCEPPEPDESPAACVFPRCVEGEKPPHCGNCEGRETPYAHEYGASAAHTERVTLPANRVRPGDLIGGVPVVETVREFPENRLSGIWLRLDDGTWLHRLETCEVEVDVKR